MKLKQEKSNKKQKNIKKTKYFQKTCNVFEKNASYYMIGQVNLGHVVPVILLLHNQVKGT